MNELTIYDWDNIVPLAQHAHSRAVSRGFWNERRLGRYHIDHYMVQVFAKLGKALEADRINRWAILSSKTIKKLEKMEGEPYAQMFESEVKYTVEYEIANACIRLLDFLGSMTNGGEVIEAFILPTPPSISTFPTNLFLVMGWTNNPFQETETDKSNTTRIIRILRTIAKCYAFDLMKHVELQMKYNETRPAKHGKKY